MALPPTTYRGAVTPQDDDSQTELAWRAIVDNYGDRASLTDGEPDPASEEPEEPQEPEETSYDVEEVEPDPPEVERFSPPPPPPLPMPSTWQRGVAWGGVFLAPALALVLALVRVYVPSIVGWGLVAWFVGGFLYLLLIAPRAPREPWDDGSRI